jgi:hypothetical protein
MNSVWIEKMIEYLNDPEEFPTIQHAQQHARTMYEQVVSSNESPRVIEKWQIVCTLVGVEPQSTITRGV